MVEAITNSLNEEKLQKLVTDRRIMEDYKKTYQKKLLIDKQKYIEYKKNIQEIKEEITQEKDKLKNDDSRGIYRASRSRSKQGTQYDREKKEFKIKDLERRIDTNNCKIKKLEQRYPNENLSNIN